MVAVECAVGISCWIRAVCPDDNGERWVYKQNCATCSDSTEYAYTSTAGHAYYCFKSQVVVRVRGRAATPAFAYGRVEPSPAAAVAFPACAHQCGRCDGRTTGTQRQPAPACDLHHAAIHTLGSSALEVSKRVDCEPGPGGK
mmetsp:Transcript_16507/g.39863  ORF Transcript_16507/g.39863 Transcript_16507/m.39863 type:complete len:142 (+) Transcript_16507:75-500(+)